MASLQSVLPVLCAANAFLLLILATPAAAFSGGVVTWYGAPKSGGACLSNYVYPGFRTVAMNKPQYGQGEVCGACVRACFSPPQWYVMQNGPKSRAPRCENLVVNNICPGCAFGSLDLGWRGEKGRWPVTWNYIPCPKATPQFRTVGSNPNYVKLKIEGMGAIKSVTCMGSKWKLSHDGFWISVKIGGKPGKWNCGFTCVIVPQYGKPLTKWFDGSYAGGGCSGK